MGIRINQNLAAMNAHRHLAAAGGGLARSLERLSSGTRVNRAADDAAGLVVSESLRSQVIGLTRAIKNTQDGVSVVQTAEGALTEVHALLQRMRELTVQAASTGSTDAAARQAAQAEVDQLVAEVDRIARTTRFAGQHLLDGTYGGATGAAVSFTGVDATPSIPARVATVTASADAITDLQRDYSAGSFYVSIDGGPAQLVVFDVDLTGASAAQVATELQDALDDAVGAGVLTAQSYTNGANTGFLIQRVSQAVGARVQVSAGAGSLYTDLFEVAGPMANVDPGSPTQRSVSHATAVPALQRDFAASPETFRLAVDGGPAVDVTLDVDLTGAAAATIGLALENAIFDALGPVGVTVGIHTDATGSYFAFERNATALGSSLTFSDGAGSVHEDLFGVGTPVVADGWAERPILRTNQAFADSLADLQRDFSGAPETFMIGLDGAPAVAATINANLVGATLAQVVAEIQQAVDAAIGANQVLVGTYVFDTAQTRPEFEFRRLQVAGTRLHEDSTLSISSGIGSVFLDIFEGAGGLLATNANTRGDVYTPASTADPLADLQSDYTADGTASFLLRVDGGAQVEVVLDVDLTGATVNDIVNALQQALDDAAGAGVVTASVDVSGANPVFQLTRASTAPGTSLEVEAGISSLYQDLFETAAPLSSTVVVGAAGIPGSFMVGGSDSVIRGEPVAPLNGYGTFPNGQAFEISLDGQTWQSIVVAADWDGDTLASIQADLQAALDAVLGGGVVVATIILDGLGDWMVELREVGGAGTPFAARPVDGADLGSAPDALFSLLFGTSAELDGVSGEAAVFQVGSHADDTIELGIEDLRARALGIDDLDVSAAASAALALIDDAIGDVSAVRGELGAVQNRFAHTISNLAVSVENLSASESRIRDTDMAAAVVELTRARILQESGMAMLAQANRLPETVLALLPPST